MTAVNAMLAATNAFAGVVAIAAALPLRRGRVRRNAWYGVRTARALASDESWYDINRHGAGWLLWYGATLLAIAVVALLLRAPASGPLFWCLLLAPAILVVIPTAAALAYSARYRPPSG